MLRERKGEVPPWCWVLVCCVHLLQKEVFFVFFAAWPLYPSVSNKNIYDWNNMVSGACLALIQYVWGRVGGGVDKTKLTELTGVQAECWIPGSSLHFSLHLCMFKIFHSLKFKKNYLVLETTKRVRSLFSSF